MHYSDDYPIAILEDGEDWWPIIGNQKLRREPYKSKEEVIKRIKKTDWEFIGAVAVTLAKSVAEQEIINYIKLKQDGNNTKA